MKERPLILNGDMVRATIDGRKTHTRRVITRPEQWMIEDTGEGHFFENKYGDSINLLDVCPYGKIGDELWVRETFWSKHDTDFSEYHGKTIDYGPCLDHEDYCEVDYCATPNYLNPPELKYQQKFEEYEDSARPGYWWLSPPDDWKFDDEDYRLKFGTWVFMGWDNYFTKHPSIHMPRWASRIQLRIKDIRVERVKDITEEDAKAEGIKEIYDRYAPFKHDLISSFAVLWDDINDKRGFGWRMNPWVWVIEFERID